MKFEASAVDSSIKDMDHDLTHLNKEFEDLRGIVKDKDKQIESLHSRHLYLESYSRRENLIFFGMPARPRGKMLLAQLMFCAIF